MTEKEFFSKICIVVEEADLSNDIEELEKLRDESIEIVKIMSKAKNSTFKN